MGQIAVRCRFPSRSVSRGILHCSLSPLRAWTGWPCGVRYRDAALRGVDSLGPCRQSQWCSCLRERPNCQSILEPASVNGRPDRSCRAAQHPPQISNARQSKIGFSDKFTVLEMSSWCGHLEVVDALSRYPGIKLSRGRPGPDYRDMGLFTALSLAASVGHIEIVRLLLARGANPRVHDNKALSCAVYAGHFAIAALLLEAGCDINLVIKKGMVDPMTLLS
ncbi:ankyrin repeat-containing domain protein [Geranomyces variabilis]|nr:ankyrin repeat-containing domain protein [Geranomyces variabilis]